MFKLIATILIIGSFTSLSKTGKETVLHLINSVKSVLAGKELVEIDHALQRYEIMESTENSNQKYPPDGEFKEFMGENFTSKSGSRKAYQDLWDSDLYYHSISSI